MQLSTDSPYVFDEIWNIVHYPTNIARAADSSIVPVTATTCHCARDIFK